MTAKNKALSTLLLECQESKINFLVLHRLIIVVECYGNVLPSWLDYFSIYVLCKFQSMLSFGLVAPVCLTLGSYNFLSRSCLTIKGFRAHYYCARQIHVATSPHVINQAREKGRGLRITHRPFQRVCYLRVQFTSLIWSVTPHFFS